MADYNQIYATLRTTIQETYPSADVSTGTVLDELLVKLAAQVQFEQENNLEQYSQTSNIATILSQPDATYTPQADAIASNFDLVRRGGVAAVGSVRITILEDMYVYIPVNTEFSNPATGLTYVTTQAYQWSPSVSSTTPRLTPGGQGTYFFILPITATEPGAGYQLPHDTPLVCDTLELLTVVDMVTYGQFTPGVAEESDQELVTRISSEASMRIPCNVRAITKLCKELVPTTTAVQVVGAEDPEETRSNQNVVGISTFGMADVYVRTSSEIITDTVSLSGVLNADGWWEVAVPAALLPGAYTVSALSADSGRRAITGQEIEYLVQQYDSPAHNWIPNPTYGRFTQYQAAMLRVRIEPTLPDAVPGDTIDVAVQLTGLPHIQTIQEQLFAADHRLPSADYLVKAAIPCVVEINLTLYRKSVADTATTLNLPQLRQDIANYVNFLGFGKALEVSNIVDLCHNYNIASVSLPVVVRGVLYYPSGQSVLLSSTDTLQIPQDLENGVSPKVAQFICSASNVHIDLQ